MEEENKQEQPAEEIETPEVQEDISLSDAMTGVITEPGNTFGLVKVSLKKNYWIIPVLIFIVLYIASTFLVLNDEELYSEIKTKQTTAVKERFEKAVKSGKMTQADADSQMEKMEKGFSKSSPIFYVFTVAGPIFTTFILLFIKGVIFLGVLKMFRGTGSYMNILSVLGLASIIEIIQVIIDTVLAILRGKLNSNIGPALLFGADSVGENMFKFIAHFDVLTIWYLVVLAIGFAKVSQLKSAQTVPAVFVLWLIWISLTSFLNLGFFGM